MANPEIQPMLDTIGFVYDPSSIENLTSENKQTVNCYPNPASKQVNIEFLLEKSSSITIEITNVNGNLVQVLEKNQFFAKGKHQIGLNIGSIAPGFYLMKIQTEQGNIVKKLLIQ